MRHKYSSVEQKNQLKEVMVISFNCPTEVRKSWSLDNCDQTNKRRSCPLGFCKSVFISNQRQVLTQTKRYHILKKRFHYLHSRELKMHKYLHKEFWSEMRNPPFDTFEKKIVENIGIFTECETFPSKTPFVSSFRSIRQQTGDTIS